ncbi:MAG TPA: hypothetical protein VMG36_08560 [Thermoplasmata archaeon]|nr:hypothetical protein [Thermoplasmata archaeon]
MSRTPVLDWLLEEDQPSVRYYALTELLGRAESDPDVRTARRRLARTGWAADLLRRQGPDGYWESRAPKSVQEHLFFLWFPEFATTIWNAVVLADLGLTRDEPRIRRTAERIFDYKLQFSSPINLFYEEVCAVGLTARTLTRFGYGDDRRVRKLFDWMLEDQRENGGWNCQPEAPGTLDGWEALAAFAAVPKARRSRRMERAIARGAEFYLERALTREGRKYAPWFRFHYPTHYFYDVLVGLDVLTQLGYGGDRRLRPALRLLEEKRRPDGRWALDRVHPDFGDGPPPHLHGKLTRLALEKPRRPSKWITLTALRVLHRVELAT